MSAIVQINDTNSDEPSTEETKSNETEQLIDSVFSNVKCLLAEKQHFPTATYRIQFNRNFTFNQARNQLEFLARLGISDLYASPYFKAKADSMHGYDITNHNELNSSIGTNEEYDALVEELHRQGMSQVLDIVPNHMGIGETGNQWWMEVLENGPSSIYAPYFDIEWKPLKAELNNKVLLPVLGDMFGTVLENKELQVFFVTENGSFELHYWDHCWPINPRTYFELLNYRHDELLETLGADSEAALEYESILTALRHLPRSYTTDSARILERNREKEIIKRRIATLCAQEPRFCDFVKQNVEIFNGVAGEPRSFDLLDDLLKKQAYRLSYWRVAAEEINYRRFFDVNELAAVRVDQPQVFEETHKLIFRLLREGRVNGLRLDHVDGLRNPALYFDDLQRGYFREICRMRLDEMKLEGEERTALEEGLLARYEQERKENPRGDLARALYVVAEKILSRGETLPSGWPIYGTTGYEFTNQVNGLFVDSANQKTFDQLYFGFIGEKIKYGDLAYQSKKQIMLLSLASEVNVLTNLLNKISESNRHYRDLTIYSLRQAVREVIACFPVYRTYITRQHSEPDKQDQQYIEAAIKQAKRRNPTADQTVFDFIRTVLMLRYPDYLSQDEIIARYNFVMKFQQCTGPVIAKGLEDTAFYIYNRLISLNEVGGEPDQFGLPLAVFHRQQAERLRNWPYSILTTSTHDTKRSEDVRARINVLSEMPKEWRAALNRWARFNRKHKTSVEGQLAPSRNEEYFLYQTLLGMWPFQAEANDEAAYSDLIARVKAYMCKAMKEAKVNTSWVNANEDYEAAVMKFIEAILDRQEPKNRFLPDFMAFQKRVAYYGVFNALSQTLLKLTCPGVPDIYQGNETWDFSLVDPDNRRPVDYDLRRRMLNEVSRINDPAGAEQLVEHKEDGRIKLFVTNRALSYRRDNQELFERGSYIPLEAQGTRSENICAFARNHDGKEVIVVAPRFYTRLAAKVSESGPVVGSVWAGSGLLLPQAETGQKYRNIFTGEEFEVKEQDNSHVGLPLDEVLSTFPVALLERMK